MVLEFHVCQILLNPIKEQALINEQLFFINKWSFLSLPLFLQQLLALVLF